MESSEDISNLVAALTERKWPLVLSLVLVYLTRWVGSDTRLPIDIPGKYKPLVLLGLNALSFAVAKVATGIPWDNAAGLAAVSFLFGLGAHSTFVLPTGKDLPIPKAAKKPPEAPDASAHG